ncbi:hypothetical protein BCY84_00420 [Trypanosoma cruzi cruzi]|nr:putative DnaJ domain containing protein [Trypanosoma cruzi]PBJ72572.1 hypothetical protein BCY84_15427 [Trypanosoma cruzi cruzi]PBJ81232.1 hypothetical protein BCY84_00420 [Trypanosoma cruzi cruzi]PWU86034.1 hypothetical protein C4B63_135g19 [Trypanosoma cruzi]PWU90850.1 hypothetical protein C4B63_47g20 [Trypanosoma cruzi]
MKHRNLFKNNNLGLLREFKNEGPLKGTTARNTLQKNSSFAAFVDRMHAINRVFLVKKKRESEVETVSCPDPVDGDARDEARSAYIDAETKWLDCCLREFLERKSRYGTRKLFLLRLLGVLIVLMGVLWYFWPLWECLIDVEADAHFRVLAISPSSQPNEIKRAYREAVKRWHPDRNPNCESCRIQMIKIQQAHDVLLARGSQRFKLAEKYREELLQLRSLVFFRLYDMAFYAAQELYYFLRGNFMRNNGDEKGFSLSLQVGCRILTMGLFTMYEFLYISGFNIVVIFQMFYYCVSVTRISVAEREMSRMVKHSYFDFYREAVMFAGMPLLFHLSQRLMGKVEFFGEDGLEFFFRMSFGILYVLSHLYRMTPNIWDNVSAKKCSIPLNYLRLPAKSISYQNFLLTELGVILDDLFAFTCRVPSIYRFTVIVVHVIFLCELAWLPSDPPATVNLGRQYEKKRLRKKADIEKGLNSNSEREMMKYFQHHLSPQERNLVENLDDETITWIDVVTTKYKQRMDATVAAYMRQKRGSIRFDLVSTSDLQEVVLLSITQSSPGSSIKVDVLFRVKDEMCSRLLALQRGPLGCVPPEASESEDYLGIIRRYAKITGKEGLYTPSEIWGLKLSSKKIKENDGAMNLVAFLFVCLLCVAAFSHTPSIKDYLRYSTDLSYFHQPLRDKWRVFLPSEHLLKRNGAGLITIFGHVFCFVDVLDVLKHMCFSS